MARRPPAQDTAATLGVYVLAALFDNTGECYTPAGPGRREQAGAGGKLLPKNAGDQVPERALTGFADWKPPPATQRTQSPTVKPSFRPRRRQHLPRRNFVVGHFARYRFRLGPLGWSASRQGALLEYPLVFALRCGWMEPKLANLSLFKLHFFAQKEKKSSPKLPELWASRSNLV